MRGEVADGPEPEEVGRELGWGGLEPDTSSSETGERSRCGDR